MANTKVTGDLIASGTITAANLVSGTLDTLLNGYLTTNAYATESYVTTAVSSLIDAAPASLDTLNELAAALNDDANFATTVTDSIATKLPLAGGNITGNLSVDTNLLFVDTANDRVGIGTSSPSTKLHLADAADSIIRIQRTGVQELQLNSDGTVTAGSTDLKLTSTSNVSVTAGGTERMRIDSSGNVGIGTSSPAAVFGGTGGLDASGYVIARGGLGVDQTNAAVMQYSGSGRVDIRAYGATAGSGHIALRTGGGGGSGDSERMRITSSGNVGIGTTSPVYDLDFGTSSASTIRLISENGGTAIRVGAGDTSNDVTLLRVDGESNNFTGDTDAGGLGFSIKYLGSGTGNNNAFAIMTDGATAPDQLTAIGILQDGKVGIGTNSPQYKSHITSTLANNVTDVLALHNGSNASGAGTGARLLFKLSNFETAVEDRKYASIEGVSTSSFNESIDLVFKTQASASGGNPSERMRITSGGSIGIGTTNPQHTIHISSIGNAKIFLEADTDNFNEDHNAAVIYSQDGGLVVGRTGFQTGTNSMEVWNTLGPVVFGAADVERMHISPDFGLIANTTVASDAGSKTFMNALNVNCGLIPVPAGGTLYLYSRYSGVNRRVLLSSSTYFTGQHGNKPIDTDLKNNIEKYIGLIVSSVGSYYSVNPITEEVSVGKNAITISEALPEIKLTDKDQDKAVWGVITNVKNDNYNTDGTHELDNNTEWGDRLGEDIIRVNGLGEGAIWVTNINGNIENGDYICSSIIPGYGKKQNDDLLHNYTVAKSTMDCDFDLNNNGLYLCEEFEFEGVVYKKAFIGCTYHCS